MVQVFTTAAGVNLPYNMKLMHTQLIPEFKVMLGKDFDIVADAPAGCAGQGLHVECGNHDWRPGNAAKRLFVGMGSGT